MRFHWIHPFLIAVGFAGGFLVRGWIVPEPPVAPQPAPRSAVLAEGEPREVEIGLVLDMATSALDRFTKTVDDYVAILHKHEQDQSGTIQPPSSMMIKIMTRHRGGKPNQNLKAYLRFIDPPAVAGREVIWVEGENDGNMLVREAGLVGAMMTAHVDPEGFLAMRGQRYPISEIGLTNLIEKLIERGQAIQAEQADGERNVRVLMTAGERSFIRIEREQPTSDQDDFSVAEIVMDTQRELVLEYRSFGWPESPENPSNSPPPLIESYRYEDVRLNVGLTDLDFDTQNPEYTFKKETP